MIVGVVGRKRSGKDTIGEYLVNNYMFARYSFASPIKKVCNTIFGWGDEHENGKLKEVIDPRWGISPRQAYQHVGSDWAQFSLPENFPEFARVTGRKLWVKIFTNWYYELIQMEYGKYFNIVITDVRFLHEVEVLREEFEDTSIWRVDRPSLGENTDLHISEQEMMQIVPDVIIENSGSLEDLYDSIDVLMEEDMRNA